MKKLLKSCAFVLIAALMLSCVACKHGGKETQKSDYAVWSELSHVIVMQEIDYNAKSKPAATFGVSAARGEYEAAQIIISAGTTDVKNYTIEISDLKSTSDASKVISADYIDVYNEKYIEVSGSRYKDSIGLGFYPDALLPFDTAVEYGENNVKAGKNQGIYIAVFIPRTAAAGEYTGTFKLTVDGNVHSIPASVNVWDFEVSKERNYRTNYGVTSIGFAELDTTQELQAAYFDFFARDGAVKSAMNNGWENRDEWLENVRKWTNPNLTDDNGKPLLDEKESYLAGISMPNDYDATTGIGHATFDSCFARLLKASVLDKYNYISKCYTYLYFIDEPVFNNTWDKVNFVSRKFEERKAYWAGIFESASNGDVAAIQTINTAAESDLGASDFVSLDKDFVSSVVDSIYLYQNYVTSAPDSRLDKTYVKNFCAPAYSTETAADLYKQEKWTEAEESNIFYCAGTSTGGNLIDMDRLHQRLNSWIAYSRNKDGLLVWATTLYQKVLTMGNDYGAIDPYETSNRISNGIGDGYLYYPGAPYGIYGPVTSLRQMQYRDSFEEYEYFYYLDSLYSSAGQSCEQILSRIFETLIFGNKLTDDHELFEAQREAVVNLILLAQKGVFVTSYQEINGVASIDVVSLEQEKITQINSQATDSTTAKVSTDMKTTDGVLSFTVSSGIKFVLRVGGRATCLFAPETDSVAVINGSEKGEDGSYIAKTGVAEKAKIPNTDINAVKTTFGVDTEINQDYCKYDISFNVDKSKLNQNVDYMTAVFYNDGEEDVLVQCYIVGSGSSLVKDMVLRKGLNVFYITRVDLAKWQNIKNATSVRFTFSSYDKSDNFNYTVYCGGVYAVK